MKRLCHMGVARLALSRALSGAARSERMFGPVADLLGRYIATRTDPDEYRRIMDAPRAGRWPRGGGD
ncbi:MAG: hypothetical protein QME96_18865, partial [Myxococcota bacterium]|nr:hypothetical protein [Myxococcota bacterium]